MWTIVSGSQYCSTTNWNGNGLACITDGINITTDHNERCTIRADIPVTISPVMEFDVELSPEGPCLFDYMEIHGTRYCGTTGPANVRLEAGETITWFTDGQDSNTNSYDTGGAEGFVLCGVPIVASPYSPPGLTPSPPPPNAPSPQPPGLCAQTCVHPTATGDGVCDDGGPGSEHNACALGTDCADCGVRLFDSCAVGCVADTLADEPPMRENRICDDACNRVRCNYDNNACNIREVISTCVPLISTSLSSPPRTTTADEWSHNDMGTRRLSSFSAEVHISSVDINVDAVTGTTVVVADVVVESSWIDARIVDPDANACCRADVMNNLINLNKFEARVAASLAESENHLQNFWMPSLAMQEEESSTLRSREYATRGCVLNTTGGGSIVAAGGGDPNVLADGSHAKLSVDRRVSVKQQWTSGLVFYPFDNHTILFVLEPNGDSDNLTNCGASNFLSRDFSIQDSPEWSVKLDKIIVTPWGEDAGGACAIIIPIHRRPFGVVISQLVPALLIVGGGLGAMWLDPTVPPMMVGLTN